MIAGGLRGRPRNTPNIVSPVMAAARSTEGSAFVRTTKKPRANRPAPNRVTRLTCNHVSRPRMGARNIATFSPETAVR